MLDTSLFDFLRRLFSPGAKKEASVKMLDSRSVAENLRLFQSSPRGETLQYRPVHLNVYTNTTCTLACKMCYGHSAEVDKNFFSQSMTREMDLATFELVLNHVPTVQSVCFSGWGEPFLNAQIFDMVQAAYAFNGARSRIVTNGLLIENRLDALMASPLDTLVVSLNGVNPESYERMTGMPPENFVTAYGNVEKLVGAVRYHRGKKLKILLSFVVDRENFMLMPQMLEIAKKLGVQGVVFENFAGPDPNTRSERTLCSDETEVWAILAQLRSLQGDLEVTLPVLLDRNMENHRFCQDAFTSVGVDGDCTISACSKQYLYHGKMGKIWETDFWNNQMFQWLRGVHGGPGKHPVPRPCQHCTNNCAMASQGTSQGIAGIRPDPQQSLVAQGFVP